MTITSWPRSATSMPLVQGGGATVETIRLRRFGSAVSFRFHASLTIGRSTAERRPLSSGTSNQKSSSIFRTVLRKAVGVAPDPPIVSRRSATAWLLSSHGRTIFAAIPGKATWALYRATLQKATCVASGERANRAARRMLRWSTGGGISAGDLSMRRRARLRAWQP